MIDRLDRDGRRIKYRAELGLARHDCFLGRQQDLRDWSQSMLDGTLDRYRHAASEIKQVVLIMTMIRSWFASRHYRCYPTSSCSRSFLDIDGGTW